MITPVTFISNYTVRTRGHNKENQKKFREFMKFSDNFAIRHNCTQILEYKIENKFPYYYKGSKSLCVPNELDELVEGYCNFHGIKYKKS